MEIKLKRKFRTSVMCGIAIFVLMAVLFFCLSLVNTINHRMNDSAASNLLNTTQVIADTLEGFIEKDYDSLNVVGTVYKSNETLESEQLLAFCETMELDWIGIVNGQGEGMDCFGNQYRISEYPEAIEWNLREEGYSDAYIGQRSGRSQITLWVPIYKEDDYLGAVLGNVILTQYYSANVFTFYNGDGRTYLFDGADGSWILKSLGTDGTSVWQNDIYSLLAASENRAEDIAVFRETVEAGKSGTAVLNFNGEQSYLCFLAMPSSPKWYVATVIAKDVLLRESSEVQRMIRWVLSILFITVTAAAIFLIYWFVRKTKLREAHYREALFANISANLDSAFLIYDKKGGKTVFVSDNIKRLLGLNREWLSKDAGRLFEWCKIPEDDVQRMAFLKGTLDKPVVREVCVENELGEKERTIRLELIPADLEQELAVLTDITKDKDIQNSLIETMQRAEAASNAKNDFLSAMSHDLRTPINGIVGMTAIAAAHLDDKNRVLDCLTKVSESTAHLLSLINEVLDMSQIDSGKLELTSEPFNLAKLLQDVLSVNYPGIEQKNHTVKVHIHLMEHEEVIGDPARLTRITANLISNAIKYTPSGGTIQLTLREKEPMIQGYGCYELLVQDNGIGISREFQDKLFEPFEREEDVQISRIQGTGLGLSIAKNLVELMMGNIQVESKKGEGTTFRVTLNLRLDEKEAKANSRLAGLPVLVVDDDITTCEAVTDILCNIGMNGEWVDNGVEAIKLIAYRHQIQEDYLAVLLDWKMPEMDGVETARRIRNEVGAKVPIIILTAYDWSEIEEEARAAGVDAFLSKPIYKAKLLQKMTEIVDGKTEISKTSISLPPKDILSGQRVLLAEDNALNKEIAVELLRMMGIEADWAENGAAAVEIFAASAPGTYNLILMDIQMPKMNGYDATRMIRSMDRPDSQTVSIVAMTADAFKKDEQAAYEAGMDEHLAKPISVDRLTQVLMRHLSHPIDKREENENEEY